MPTENLNDGLAHLCWRRIGQQRTLLFGWFEQLPPAYPILPGHPYRASGRLGGSGQLYVGRFPISGAEAQELFASAAQGLLLLPSYPEAPSPGDGAPLTCGPFVEEPAGGSSATSLSLPFLPPSVGPVIVKALFACRTQTELPLTSREAAWIHKNMFIDLVEHSEYLGALLLVRHHPVVRSVHCRLHTDDGRESELVNFLRWQKTSIAGHRVLAIQHSRLGSGRPLDLEAEDLMQLDFGSALQKTSLIVHHPDVGLAWCIEPSDFLRTIVANLDIVNETRRIVQPVAAGGSPMRYFDVSWRGQRELATIAVVGDPPQADDLSMRVAIAENRRRGLALAAQLGLKWFDNPEDAQNAIRQLIGTARNTVSIFDAYFGINELYTFVTAVSAGDITIEVITSAEYLNKKGGLTYGKLFQQSANQLESQGWMTPTVLVLPGTAAALHDRFICIDGRIWLSGNSLNAIGERASMLIEIPNAQEIRGKLDGLPKLPLPEWLKNKEIRQQRRVQ